jgi:hypothetical protein
LLGSKSQLTMTKCQHNFPQYAHLPSLFMIHHADFFQYRIFAPYNLWTASFSSQMSQLLLLRSCLDLPRKLQQNGDWLGSKSHLTVTNCQHNCHQHEEESWLRRRNSNVTYLFNFIIKLIYCRDAIFFCSRHTLSFLPAVFSINSVVWPSCSWWL